MELPHWGRRVEEGGRYENWKWIEITSQTTSPVINLNYNTLLTAKYYHSLKKINAYCIEPVPAVDIVC